MHADDFYTSHRVNYDPAQARTISYSSIKALEFLNGCPWNDLALAYVHALRPSAIRVTAGEETMDSVLWRVTVYVEEGCITGIRQEVEVWCPDGVENGHDLGQQVRHQRQKHVVPK